MTDLPAFDAMPSHMKPHYLPFLSTPELNDFLRTWSEVG
jgi:hypothetical protein